MVFQFLLNRKQTTIAEMISKSFRWLVDDYLNKREGGGYEWVLLASVWMGLGAHSSIDETKLIP